MEEHKVYTVSLDGLFPESDGPVRAHGTSGEVLEQIADMLGLGEDDSPPSVEVSLDGVYPSIRAYRAHQMLEDRLAKLFGDPDSLMDALIREGLVRYLTEDEYERWIEEQEMEDYEEARGELDDEWRDGLWET